MISTIFKILSVAILINALPIQENPELNGGNFEGDMILSPEQFRELSAPRRSGYLNERYRWPNARVPYYVPTSSFTSSQINRIKEAMRIIEGSTCVRFIQYTSSVPNDYVRFSRPSSVSCSSMVGRQGGAQSLNLHSDCLNNVYVVVHELLHAIGFFHMQSSAERDSYVRINWQNIQPGYENNFDKYSSNTVTNFGTTYDYGSVMHYTSNAFAKSSGLQTITALKSLNGATMGQRSRLSSGDITRINKMYRC